MSNLNPERILFEDETDVIDYVSRGMIPSKKNFESFITGVRCPLHEGAEKTAGTNMSERLFLDCDNASMEIILRRVYDNRIHNRNTMLIASGIVVAGCIFGAIGMSSKKDSSTEHDQPQVKID